jgi:hypothetical protein
VAEEADWLLCPRWFDKSFSFVVYKNGKNGLNAEHSWADAPRLPNALDPLGAFLASPVSGEEKSRRLSARLPVCSLPRPARRQTLS